MTSFSQFRVLGPPEVYYIPNFVNEEEEQFLLRKINESSAQKWKQLANRRLQIWGGEIVKNVLFQVPIPPYFSTHPNIVERLRSLGTFSSSPHGAPNHVILNEYLPGQGIMPHEDGPSYFPTVATISLGSHTVFHYYRYQDAEKGSEHARPIDPIPALSVFLEPRSVIITASEMYTSYLHGIEDRDEDTFELDQGGILRLGHTSTPIANQSLLTADSLKMFPRGSVRKKRGVRHSLTCRDVAKVSAFQTFRGR